jgi:hypothetical protein
MHDEIALFGRFGESLRKFTRDDALLPKDCEDVGVVGWGSRRLLDDEPGAEVDADLNGDLKPALGRGTLFFVGEICVLPISPSSLCTSPA